MSLKRRSLAGSSCPFTPKKPSQRRWNLVGLRDVKLINYAIDKKPVDEKDALVHNFIIELRLIILMFLTLRLPKRCLLPCPSPSLTTQSRQTHRKETQTKGATDQIKDQCPFFNSCTAFVLMINPKNRWSSRTVGNTGPVLAQWGKLVGRSSLSTGCLGGLEQVDWWQRWDQDDS